MSAVQKPIDNDGRDLSASDILNNARKLADKIRERDLSTQYDELRKLPRDLFEDLRETGVLRMNMPKSWGGPEMTAMEQIEVIEALARGDASVAWTSFIWTDSGIYSGYLDDAVAREMYPRLDMAQSGWVYPVGRADRVAGGYRISGQWMFGSGCNHCDWLAAGCLVHEDGKPAITGDNPFTAWRIMIAKPEEFEIQDTWYTTGLRGTGSNDYRCADVFVPEERSFTFLEPARRKGTIWARNDHFLRKMSGVPLGVAAEAIDVCRSMLAEKVDRATGQFYRDIPRVQSAVAEAQMKLGRARSYVFDSVEKQWRKIERGEPLTETERANVWLSRVNAFQTGREVVSLLYDTVGGSAIYTHKTPLDRQMRDMQTLCQHLVGQYKSMEGVGDLLLGGKNVFPMI